MKRPPKQKKQPVEDPDELFARGVELDEEGHVDEAARVWRRVVEIDPTYAPAWYNLGVVEKDAGSWRAAIELFDRAHAEDPDDAPTLHCRGHMYQELGEDEAARADLERAIELYTEQLEEALAVDELLFWRGAARARLGERDAALADLAAAIDVAGKWRDEAREEVDYRPLADDPEFVEMTRKPGRRRR